MEFLGQRIKLNPRPVQTRQAALEVAMLGHCPGEVRIDRLLALSDALEDIRLLGFGPRLEKLIELNENLFHLPIPLRSTAEFFDIFPDVSKASSEYQSTLAGNRAWLAVAVEEFFANGGEKLWVVQIPESEMLSGFLPHFDSPLYDVENLRGIASVLILNRVGIVALPDLERLQVPANLPDIPRKRLANPEPKFIPCSETIDDGSRERRYSSELPVAEEPVALTVLLKQLLGFINQHRPDMQCVFSMPLTYSEARQSPAIDQRATQQLDVARTQTSAHLLRQVQFIFPYLRSVDRPLYSAAGALCGLMASSARERGVWRSIADVHLMTNARPFPELSMQQQIALRESPGIGVLCKRKNRLFLDDERLCVPALHKHDYLPGQYSAALLDMRAGEVARFLGFLLRELRELGERLIFAIDYRDPRPRLILEKFFNRLYDLGALRGNLPEEAFTINQSAVHEAVIAYDIEIAPAFPIDKIQLTFINRQGNWLAEVANG